MASNALGGTAFLKVDGQQFLLRGSFKVYPNTIERTGVAGADGPHGYTEKYNVPSIEGDISDSGGLSIQALTGITNSTVTLELVNGKTYVLSNAWYSGQANLDGVTGSLPVKFEGMRCAEILAAGA
ncbi:phage tail tube protein [Acidocella sp.]|uniref:phage tail tube protein n=1 Tax=Acidocella sp. TaxID=50710 RepID=UPI0026398147|nr:phage tail tube protein [Acidocella sp.]MDD2794362.1 phage tail tube protein [Acidocella sp.]